MAEASGRADELAALWTWFADSFLPEYSPLYRSIATFVAGDREVLDLVLEAPPQAHLPLVLLGAVHYLVLGNLDHPLADLYEGRRQAGQDSQSDSAGRADSASQADPAGQVDPGPLFHDLCLSHRDELLEIMAERRVQTNEVARSALIAPAITKVSGTFDGPLHLVDVGASSGLNLLCDRYLLDYGSSGRCGPADAPVRIACAVRGGRLPVADRLEPFASRVGIDLDPPDLTDPDDVRWLLACVWPGTGRLERARAAIALAQKDPPKVLRGDATDLLPAVLDGLTSGGVVCVLTTWSFSYLLVEQRQRFVELLTDRGRERPVVWIAGDASGVADLGPGEKVGAEGDVLTAATFDGSTAFELLAQVHPHGQWIDWRA